MREDKVFLSDALAEKLLHRAVGGEPVAAARSPVEELSNRELEELRFIGQGVKSWDIAERLHLSIKTIETYRDRIRLKLDLSDSTELTRYAIPWL